MRMRKTQGVLVPDGEPIYSERGYTLTITDDSGGEFLVVFCHDDQCQNGEIRLDPSDWPALRSAIDEMVKECRQYD